jgi:gamma-glutamyl phosphate reductase
MNDFERLTLEIGQKARKSAKITANLPTKIKNQILLDTAEGILAAREFLQAENSRDLEKAHARA